MSNPNSKMMILGSADVQIYKSCVDVPSGLSPTLDKNAHFHSEPLWSFFYTQVELFTCQLETDFVQKMTLLVEISFQKISISTELYLRG